MTNPTNTPTTPTAFTSPLQDAGEVGRLRELESALEAEERSGEEAEMRMAALESVLDKVGAALKADQDDSFADLVYRATALVAALAAEQAAHKLDIEVFESGAHEQTKQTKQVETLRERTLLAEAVRDSMAARVADLCGAMKAERELEANEPMSHKGLDEWRCWRKELSGKKAHTDAIVDRHEHAGVSEEAITAKALVREGWERRKRDDHGEKSEYCIKRLDKRSYLTWEKGAGTWIGGNPTLRLLTVRDANDAVRLFTEPEPDGVRERGAVVGEEGV